MNDTALGWRGFAVLLLIWALAWTAVLGHPDWAIVVVLIAAAYCEGQARRHSKEK